MTHPSAARSFAHIAARSSNWLQRSPARERISTLRTARSVVARGPSLCRGRTMGFPSDCLGRMIKVRLGTTAQRRLGGRAAVVTRRDTKESSRTIDGDYHKAGPVVMKE